MPLDNMVTHLRSFKDSSPDYIMHFYNTCTHADCTLATLAVRSPLGYWNTPETPD